MSYTWITPKTDWDVTSHFTYTDYNRIRNNLLFLNDMLNSLYPDVAEELDLGNPKSGYTNDYYASEFNAFEDALDSFKRIGQDMSIGERGYYFGNDSFISADGLNRLEKCCVRWFNMKPAIESVSLSPASFEFEVGQTKRLTLTVVPADAEYTVEWSSSNTAIATVNNGVVTAVANGSFTITATIKQMGRDDIVKTSNGVVIIDIQSITVTPEEQEYFGVNESKIFNVAVTPSNATHKDDWYINNRYPTDLDMTKIDNSSFNVKLIKSTYKISIAYKNMPTPTLINDYMDREIGNIKVLGKSITSNTFKAKLNRAGSWYNGGDTSSSIRYYYCFQLIANDVDGNNVATLLSVNGNFEGTVWGTTNRNDLNAPWRSVVQSKIDENFSVEMKSSLRTATKSVMRTATTTARPSTEKFYLPSASEFGIIDSTHLINLGNAYPYLVNNSIFYKYSEQITTRDLYNDVEETAPTPSVDNRYTLRIIANVIPHELGTKPQPDYSLTPLTPLFFVLNNMKVVELEEREGEKYYYIDWSGRSTLSLKDIPLGSRIIDINGTREHE